MRDPTDKPTDFVRDEGGAPIEDEGGDLIQIDDDEGIHFAIPGEGDEPIILE